MPTVVMWVVGAIGALAAANWIVREAHRINAELHPERHAAGDAAGQPEPVTRLRRDASGVYRPE